MCFVLKKMVIFKKPHIGSVFVRHAAIQNFVEVSNGDNKLNNIFFPVVSSYYIVLNCIIKQ